MIREAGQQILGLRGLVAADLLVNDSGDDADQRLFDRLRSLLVLRHGALGAIGR